MVGEIGGGDLEAGNAELVEHVDRLVVERSRETQEVLLFRIAEQRVVLIGTEAVELGERVVLASLGVIGLDPVARGGLRRDLTGLVALELDRIGARGFRLANERPAELEIAVVVDARFRNDECRMAFADEFSTKIDFCHVSSSATDLKLAALCRI